MKYDEQKETALKLGLTIFDSPEFEDSFGNFLLKNLQRMEEKIQELEMIKEINHHIQVSIP